MTENVTMQPLFARVLLKRPKFENKHGAIIIPEDALKKYASLKCTVVAVGPDVGVDTATVINVGDEVIIGRHAGTWLSADGNPADPEDADAEFYIVMEEDILVKING